MPAAKEKKKGKVTGRERHVEKKRSGEMARERLQQVC